MCDVIFRWMMFGMVVCQVVATFVPEDSELALSLLTFEPIETHFKVKGFDAACNDGVVDVSLGPWQWSCQPGLVSVVVSIPFHLRSCGAGPFLGHICRVLQVPPLPLIHRLMGEWQRWIRLVRWIVEWVCHWRGRCVHPLGFDILIH